MALSDRDNLYGDTSFNGDNFGKGTTDGEGMEPLVGTNSELLFNECDLTNLVLDDLYFDPLITTVLI